MKKFIYISSFFFCKVIFASGLESSLDAAVLNEDFIQRLQEEKCHTTPSNSINLKLKKPKINKKLSNRIYPELSIYPELKKNRNFLQSISEDRNNLPDGLPANFILENMGRLKEHESCCVKCPKPVCCFDFFGQIFEYFNYSNRRRKLTRSQVDLMCSQVNSIKK